MSCYDGLLELYKVTNDPRYLKAVEATVTSIIADEINIAGSGSSFECFYKGKALQTEPAYHTMETCVTMTWMKLCYDLLRLTRNPLYADQIERTVYNALLAARRRAVGRRRAVRHARKLLQYERAPRFRFAARGCRNRLRRRTVR